jgi:hypothetical protein
MGLNQAGKAPGASIQQLSRQVQVAVTEALPTLDGAKAIDPAGQDEVESLRSAIWADLTGLEAEFGRAEGPRAELLERFFSHLLSNGDYVGQIETLAGALLGGAPPPTQPPPDSPVAGLFNLHRALAGIRKQWQEMSATAASQAAAAPPEREAPRPVAPPPGRDVPQPAAVAPPGRAAPVAPPPRREPASSAKAAFFEEMGFAAAPKQEMHQHPGGRERAAAERPLTSPARQSGAERFWDDLGVSSPGAPGRAPEVSAPRPRVLLSFLTVFVILALMGVGVIWLGLSSSPQDNPGPEASPVPTIAFNLPTTTPQPTPTLSSAAPKLRVTGNPLIVPCPNKGSSGFVLQNIGGQTLTWSARVNPVGGSAQPVKLSVSSGKLYGPQGSGTDTVSVSVTANVGNIDGTISITTNIPGPNGTATITYHIHGC